MNENKAASSGQSLEYCTLILIICTDILKYRIARSGGLAPYEGGGESMEHFVTWSELLQYSLVLLTLASVILTIIRRK